MPVKEAEAANSLIDQGVDVLTAHVDSPKVIVETAETARRLRHRLPREPGDARAQGLPDRRGVELGKVYTDYSNGSRQGKSLSRTWCAAASRKASSRCRRTARPSPTDAKKKADAAKAKFMAGTMVIFKGPLKDNTGKVVIAAGAEHDQTRHRLEKMDYLVEGVKGTAELSA